MKVLITGIAGFAGSHLAELALREGAEVVGTVLPGAPVDNLAAVEKEVATVACDLTAPGAVGRLLRTARPDRVFHLAGAAVVSTSWALRADVLRTNVEATYELCEGLRAHPVPCLLVSSGEVLPLVVVRAFNHAGPRQGPGFVWSDIARQIAAIEAGQRPPVLEIGTTTTRRDFTDVRDMVRAYWLLLEHGSGGETYNAASGHAVGIGELLEGFLALARRPIEVRQAPHRVRPVDIPVLSGDASRLRALTGWAPRIPLAQTMADVLTDWRRRVAAQVAPGRP